MKSNKYYLASLLFCIVLRVLFCVNNPVLTSDNSIQYEAGKNYLMIGKLSNSYVNADNLNQVYEKPLKAWPVSLSILILLINMFSRDFIVSAVIIQIIGSLMLLFGILKTLQLLNISKKTQGLFLIFFAFSNSIFYYCGPTDVLTAGIFSWVIFFSLKLTNTNGKEWLYVVLIAVFSALAALIRMACIPNLAIVPFFLLLIYFLKKKTSYLYHSFIIGGLSLLITVLFYYYFPIDSGRTSFINNIKNGIFFFSHLKWMDPFPIKSFLYMRPIDFHLPNNPTLIFLYRAGLLILSFSFFLFLIYLSLKKINSTTWMQRVKNNNNSSLHTLLLLSTSLIVVSFISLQSVTTPPESNSFGPSWMPPFWTFVYSTRYFVYIMVGIIILFFDEMNKSFQDLKNKLVFKYLYVLFVSYSFCYFLFSNYQYYSPRGNGAASEWINEKEAIAAYRSINKIYEHENNPHIVYCHYKKRYIEGLVTNFAFAHTCNDYENIINNESKHTQPMVLILAMPRTLSRKELTYLANHSFQVLYVSNKEIITRINLS